MEAYQERVVVERAELHEKIGKLEVFLNSVAGAAVPIREQRWLTQQLEVMQQYRAILDQRIAAFPVRG